MQKPEHRQRRRTGPEPLATLDDMRGRRREQAARANDPRLIQVRGIVARLAGTDGALLPVLHEVQEALGCIPPETVPAIADGLNLSRAEVHGVITYYHHFRSAPAGRHVLELCRAESCRAMGSEALWRQACAALGLPPDGGTTTDGRITLEPVYCLGLCAASPGAMLDGRPHARLDSARLSALLESTEAVT